MQLFQKQAKPVKLVKTLRGGKSLIISCLSVGFILLSSGAHAQGEFHSPSTTVLQSPNANSAIGIVPQADWKFTLNLRGTSSNPVPSKGIDIWTNQGISMNGEPPSFVAEDVFRVMRYQYLGGSNFSFPSQVFKIDGSGNIHGGDYFMRVNSTLNFGNSNITHTLYGQNSLRWKKVNETIYGELNFSTNRRLGLNTDNPETNLHIYVDDVTNVGRPGENTYGLIIENNGWRSEDNALKVKTNQGEIFRLTNYGDLFLGENILGVHLDGYRLYVQNGIRTERIRVDIAAENGWADYVFDEDYVLMPIDELEAFIKKNKHLPGVPSAAEVVKEGIDLAEMNKILLEKIEELTLRIIELEKAKR